jgi:hypothetical protein
VLYRFELENFASFRHPQTLDLRLPPSVTPDPALHLELLPNTSVYIPKVVSISGPIASGKSNLLLAVDFALHTAARRKDAPAVCLPFNHPDTLTAPTRLTVEFAHGSTLYRYLLIIDATSPKGPTIRHESLRSRSDFTSPWQRHEPYFPDWALPASIRSPLLNDNPDSDVHRILSREPDSLLKLNAHLARLPFGVEQLTYSYSPTGPQPRLRHTGIKDEIPWPLESSGTRAFIRAFPYIDAALRQGSFCAIDDLDPFLLPEFLPLFEHHSSNAQLWFTQRDIRATILCQKDATGQSLLHSPRRRSR